MSDNRSFRINTNINKDKVVNVSMSQDIDCLEILSLKINQSDAYRLHSANYGVIVGRVLANDGFGVPNAKVSVFIELDNADKQNSEITSLYPYTSLQSRDKENRRYNLLPDTGNGDCYRIVGTFPNKRLVLDNQSQLDVFDKYWKYTTVTNNAGDYMIFGVPVGVHTVHIDVDLSDIGILSQKPRDFYYKGYEENLFENSNQFKKSSNLDDLAQIISQDKSVQVYPFWGDKDNSDVIALSRCDLNVNYKFEPTCVFMGSIITDDFSNNINHSCTPSEFCGYNDRLTTTTGTIEMIRKTPEGGVEEFSIKGNELIDGDGVWCYQIPMNLDYVKTDEYGNIVPTDNPNEGIPTRTSVRFRISTNETTNEATGRHRARYLVPNNLEFKMDGTNTLKDGSDVDSCFLFGSATPEKHFRNLYWNKIYSVKNYIPRIQTTNNNKTKNYSAIRSVNIGTTNNPHPFNKLRLHMSFNYVVLCMLLTILFKVVGQINKYIISPLRENLCVLPAKLGGGKKILWWKIPNWCPFKEWGVKCIEFTFGGVGIDGEDETYAPLCWSTTGNQKTEWKELLDRLEQALAMEFNLVNLDFYNDWINGTLYMPLWFWRKVKKKKYLWGLFHKKAVNTFCSCDKKYSKTRIFEMCAIPLKSNLTPQQKKTGKDTEKLKSSVNFGHGVIQEVSNKDGLQMYYYTPGVRYDVDNDRFVRLYATDIILLGSFSEYDLDNMPNMTQQLPPTTANIPLLTTIREELNGNDSWYEDIVPGDVNVNTTIVGDKTGALTAGHGVDREDIVITTEVTGMDWTHNTYNQTYRGGLFFDLSCSRTTTMLKTCYNARRICELGVNLDATISTEVPSETNGVMDHVQAEADGMILYQEIDNVDVRAMFATLNHNSLRLSTQNPNTKYQSHFLYYLYPQNFDGSMESIALTYSNNVSYDVADYDYIKFRYGVYNPKPQLTHIAKYSNAFPIFNNSFYFYFGLKNGKTAIDKFRTLFDAPCLNDKKYQYNVDIIKKPSSVCQTDGVLILSLVNAKLPCNISIKDSFDTSISFIQKKFKDISDDNQTHIAKLLNKDIADDDLQELNVYEATTDTQNLYDMTSVVDNNIILYNLINDEYQITIEDASENILEREEYLVQALSSASVRGVALVEKYTPEKPITYSIYGGFVEIYDVVIEGNEIIPETLSPYITIDENNTFVISGKTNQLNDLYINCQLTFANDYELETDVNNFIIRHTYYGEIDYDGKFNIELISQPQGVGTQTIGYRIPVGKPGVYTLKMKQTCDIEECGLDADGNLNGAGETMYYHTSVENGKPLTLIVNEVDTSRIKWDYIRVLNEGRTSGAQDAQYLPWGYGAHHTEYYDVTGKTYNDANIKYWEEYVPGLEVVGGMPPAPTAPIVNSLFLPPFPTSYWDTNIDTRISSLKKLSEINNDETLDSVSKFIQYFNLFKEVGEKLSSCEYDWGGKDKSLMDAMLFVDGNIIFANCLNVKYYDWQNDFYKNLYQLINPNGDEYKDMPKDTQMPEDPGRPKSTGENIDYSEWCKWYNKYVWGIENVIDFAKQYDLIATWEDINNEWLGLLNGFVTKYNEINNAINGIVNKIVDGAKENPLDPTTQYTQMLSTYQEELYTLLSTTQSQITILNDDKNNGYSFNPHDVYDDNIYHCELTSNTVSGQNVKKSFDSLMKIVYNQKITDYIVNDLPKYIEACENPPGDKLVNNCLKIVGGLLQDICRVSQGVFVTHELAHGLSIRSVGGRGAKIIRTEYPNYTIKGIPGQELTPVSTDSRYVDIVHSIKTTSIDCGVFMPCYVMPNYCTKFNPLNIQIHKTPSQYNANGKMVRSVFANNILCNDDERYLTYYTENPTALSNYISVIDNNGVDDLLHTAKCVPSDSYRLFPIENQMHAVITPNNRIKNFTKFDFIDRAIDYWVYIKAPIQQNLKIAGTWDTGELEGGVGSEYKSYTDLYGDKYAAPKTLEDFNITSLDWDIYEVYNYIGYLYYYYVEKIQGELSKEISGHTKEYEIKLLIDKLKIIFSQKMGIDVEVNQYINVKGMKENGVEYVKKSCAPYENEEFMIITNPKDVYQDTTTLYNTIASIYTTLYRIVKLYQQGIKKSEGDNKMKSYLSKGLDGEYRLLFDATQKVGETTTVTQQNYKDIVILDDKWEKAEKGIFCYNLSLIKGELFNWFGDTELENSVPSYTEFIQDKTSLTSRLDNYAFYVAKRYHINQTIQPWLGSMSAHIFNGIQMGYTKIDIEHIDLLTYQDVKRMFNFLGDVLFEAKLNIKPKVVDNGGEAEVQSTQNNSEGEVTEFVYSSLGTYNGIRYFKKKVTPTSVSGGSKETKDLEIITGNTTPLTPPHDLIFNPYNITIDNSELIIKPSDVVPIEFDLTLDKVSVNDLYKKSINLINYLEQYTKEYYSYEMQQHVKNGKELEKMPSLDEISNVTSGMSTSASNLLSASDALLQNYMSGEIDGDAYNAQLNSLIQNYYETLNQIFNDVNNWMIQTYHNYIKLYDVFINTIKERAIYYDYNIISDNYSGLKTEYQYTLNTNEGTDNLLKKGTFSLTDNYENAWEYQKFYDVQIEVNNNQYHIQDFIGNGKPTNKVGIMFNNIIKSTTKADFNKSDVWNGITPVAHKQTNEMYVVDENGTFESQYKIDWDIYSGDSWSNLFLTSKPTSSGNKQSFGQVIKNNGAKDIPYANWSIRTLNIGNIPHSYQTTLSIHGCSYDIEPETIQLNQKPCLLAQTKIGEMIDNTIPIEDSGIYDLGIGPHRIHNSEFDFKVAKNAEGTNTAEFSGATTSGFNNVNMTYYILGSENVYTQIPKIFKASDVLNGSWSYDNTAIINPTTGAILFKKVTDSPLFDATHGLFYYEEDGIKTCLDDSKLKNSYISLSYESTSGLTDIAIVARKHYHDDGDNSHLKTTTVDHVVKFTSAEINNLENDFFNRVGFITSYFNVEDDEDDTNKNINELSIQSARIYVKSSVRYSNSFLQIIKKQGEGEFKSTGLSMDIGDMIVIRGSEQGNYLYASFDMRDYGIKFEDIRREWFTFIFFVEDSKTNITYSYEIRFFKVTNIPEK